MKRRNNYWKRADSRIRWYCRKLTEKQRVVIVAMAFTLFMASCLYMIVTSLSGSGKPERYLEMEHIHPPGQMPGGNGNNEDNHLKDYYDYGHPENQDTVRLVS